MDSKTELSQGYVDLEPHTGHRANARLVRMVETTRLAVTALAFCIGVVIMSTSADALATYHQTSLAADYLVPLWPANFNLRPTVALVVGGALMVLVHSVALIAGKVSSLRQQPAVHMAVSCAAPVVGGAVAIIATAFYYSVNDSSVVDSLQSWSCRWADLHMKLQPDYGMLCSESKAALYLSVIMIPVEVLLLAVTGWGIMLEQKAALPMARQPSPAMS